MGQGRRMVAAQGPAAHFDGAVSNGEPCHDTAGCFLVRKGETPPASSSIDDGNGGSLLRDEHAIDFVEVEAFVAGARISSWADENGVAFNRRVDGGLDRELIVEGYGGRGGTGSDP